MSTHDPIDDVETEALSTEERDQLRKEYTGQILAAMFAGYRPAPPSAKFYDEEVKTFARATRFMQMHCAEFAANAADAAIAELELHLEVRRVVLAEGDSMQVEPASAMRCVHGVVSGEACAECETADASDRAADLADKLRDGT